MTENQAVTKKLSPAQRRVLLRIANEEEET